ncbi:MAG TPA: hypothetical protein VGO55_12810 [Allosphingosinicella sp.]|jgi:hypothetical protein|nr:hypothetical protein [Allosphingosinicella sp.]
MIRLLVFSLLAAAQETPPAPPEPVAELPPHFACSLYQEGPFGTVGVAQFVSPEGVPDIRLNNWSISLVPDGVAIDASWDPPGPAGYNLVWLSQDGLDPGRSYRIQIQRDAPYDARAILLESPPARADGAGRVTVHTRWEALTAMLVGASDPRILVIRDDGRIVRSDAVDPAIFARVLAAVIPLQPAMDAKIADYRHCPFSEGGPIVAPEPVEIPDQVPG